MFITVPCAPGPPSPHRATLVTRELGKIEVYSSTACSALPLNHRYVVIFCFDIFRLLVAFTRVSEPGRAARHRGAKLRFHREFRAISRDDVDVDLGGLVC